MSTEHDATNYEPVHGDQITGSPSLLSRYISTILGKGAHFQFIDGETLEVIVPGAGQAVVTSFGDTVVAAKPVEAEEIEIVVPAPEPVVESEEDLAAIEEPVVEEAPAKPATRGRKPKAAPAPEAETVEGE